MTNDIRRPLPYGIENEEAVLGAMLMDDEAIPKVAPFLRPADFYRKKHGLVYKALLNLYDRGEPADMLTVVDELEQMGKLSAVGGPAGINELVLRTPTSLHVEHYGRRVERDAVLRRLIQAAEQIAQLAYQEGETDLEEVIDRAEHILFSVSQHRLTGAMLPIRQLLEPAYERIRRLRDDPADGAGLPTGYDDIDRILKGMQAGEYIVLAARPSMGKTALSLGIVENAAIASRARVAFFSLEMSAGAIVQRHIASQTGIDSQRLRVGPIGDSDLDRVDRAIDVLGETRIFIDETPALSPMEVRTKSRRVASEYGLDLIVVDYIQLMRGGGRYDGDRVQEVSYMSRSLKALARELDVPVLALSQLSRDCEKRRDKRPMLSDLRGSGSIEQDADVVMFIYRDEIYNENTKRPSVAEINVAKHRNGPIGTAELRFVKELARFTDLNAGASEPADSGAYPNGSTGNGHQEYPEPAGVDDIIF